MQAGSVRTHWILSVVVASLVLALASVGAQAADSIGSLHRSLDQSRVNVIGLVSELTLGPAASDPVWANFVLCDDSGKIHVYWYFGSGGAPSWLENGVSVVVAGTYWIAHQKHPREPEIKAASVWAWQETASSVRVPDYSITPWGAAGEVAGSCYQFTLSGESVLIDCGSYMNGDDEDAEPSTHHDTDPFPFIASSIRAVLITHAHDDHAGRLQYLVAAGFDGPILGTTPTLDIIRKKLDDTIKYGCLPKDLQLQVKTRILQALTEVPYGQAIRVIEGLEATFLDVGHLPGSASIVLSFLMYGVRETVCFSGDVGSGHHPFLNPPDLASLSQAGVTTLVVESTYGDVTRTYDDDIYAGFCQTLSEAMARSDLVVMPSFALDRAQRALDAVGVAIEREFVSPSVRVAVGGLSSCYLTNLYCGFQDNPELYSSYFSPSFFRADAPLALAFWSYTRGAYCESAELKPGYDFKGSYDIVITPSGTGDSSLAQVLIDKYKGDKDVTFFKMGWTSPNSRMQGLVDGDTAGSAGAQVVDVSAVFSGHADQGELLAYIKAFPHLSTLIITHGEESARRALSEIVSAALPSLQIIMPGYGESIAIDASPG